MFLLCDEKPTATKSQTPDVVNLWFQQWLILTRFLPAWWLVVVQTPLRPPSPVLGGGRTDDVHVLFLDEQVTPATSIFTYYLFLRMLRVVPRIWLFFHPKQSTLIQGTVNANRLHTYHVLFVCCSLTLLNQHKAFLRLIPTYTFYSSLSNLRSYGFTNVYAYHICLG